MKINSFIEALKNINIEVDSDKLDKLKTYYEFLIEYNSHTNLTAITNEEDVYLKHFYDSLTVCNIIDFNCLENVIDIGSGAGFPGVVLKIFFPHLQMTLLDSNNKKTAFILRLVEKLNLDNINVINERAEDYALKHLNSFDLCISRAVAFVDIITELSMPFVKKDGLVVLMKGNLENEKVILEKHYHELNINEYTIKKIKLPNEDERNIVLLTKNKLTSKIMTYPQILKRNKRWNNL